MASGRFDRVTGPGLPAYGAMYSRETDSELLAGQTFNTDATTVVGEVIRSYETDRDLVTSVENKWGSIGVPPVTVSKYSYINDNLGRRTSVINEASAFSASRHNRYAYNDRHELDRSQRFEGTDPVANPVLITEGLMMTS